MPEFEEREAALFNGYTWREWTELPRGEQALGIAHMRLRRLIEAHVQEIQDAELESRRRAAAAAAEV